MNQAEVVKNLLDLERKANSVRREIAELRSMKFSPRPAEPEREIISREYPAVEPHTKFQWKIGLLPLIISFLLAVCIPVSFLWGIVGLAFYWVPIYYVIYRVRKKKECEDLTNSAEYQAQCAEIDRNWEKAQANADLRFAEQTKEYKEVIIPKYERDLQQWENEQQSKINDATNILRVTQDSLTEIYDTSKLVPAQYRTIEALEYIYDIVSTSDYDVKYAIESYDRDRQRKIEQERIREQQKANDIAAAQYQAQLDANDLAAEQNRIADDARRDANLHATIAAVQRHNANRYRKNRR